MPLPDAIEGRSCQRSCPCRPLPQEGASRDNGKAGKAVNMEPTKVPGPAGSVCRPADGTQPTGTAQLLYVLS